MWVCEFCKNKIEDHSTITCWKCGKDSINPSRSGETGEGDEAVSKSVQYKIIRGTFITWEGLAAQTAEFLDTIKREDVIGISHSSDKGDGVIMIFYKA